MHFLKKFARFVFRVIRFILNVILCVLGAAGWLLQALLQTVTVLFVLSLAAGCVVFIKVKPHLERSREVAYDTLAQMQRDDFSMLSDTEIFDKDGKRIGIINAGHYEYVDISKISLNLQNAYIAQEDRRFKSHSGVDWIATTRAGLALIKHRGAITQGGSTITQQIIKNTYLTQEQTFTRKMVEILLAPEIEKTYSKADIMEFYCNTNFYGHQCYGVQAASRYYFGKDAADLDVHEAAVLVGISNSPSAYDPVLHPDAALKKRNEVLKSMLEVDMLTEKEYENATSHTLRIIQEQQEGTDDSYLTSYAIHCAALELMKQDDFEFQYTFSNKSDYDAYMEKYTASYNEKNDSIRNGGYKIYTSLDQNIQNTVQNSLDEILSSYTELQDNGKYALQGAAVIVDNQTNYVVAIVGGRGTEDPFNRAYLSARQPGSTIKPLLDYGPAFDTGEYYPSRIIDDHQWEDGPANSGGHYYGPVTVREALNRSLNTVAWQVLEDIGIGTGLSYLDSMQFQRLTYVDNDVPALSIGGFTNGVRVVDMAIGFSTLANSGVFNDRTCIVKIEHEQQGDLTARTFAVTKQVYSVDTAFMLTDVLKGTMTAPYGTGRALGLSGGMPAAGKTGTTNNSKDTWFCGYTRYYTGAVWVGYDTPRAMPGIFGSTYAGVIWKNVMNQLHEGLEPWDWEQPETVVKDSYNPATGARLHPTYPTSAPETAPARTEPPAQPPVPETPAAQPAESQPVPAETAAPETAPPETLPVETPQPATETQPAGPAYAPADSAPQPSQDTSEHMAVPEGPPWVLNGDPVYYMMSMTGPGVIGQPSKEAESESSASPIPLKPGPGTLPPSQWNRNNPPAAQEPAVQETQPEATVPAPPAQEAAPAPLPPDTPYVEPAAQAGTNLVDYFSNRSELMAQQNITNKAQSRLLDELEDLIASFENATINSAADVPLIQEQYRDISSKLKQVQTGDDRRRLYDQAEARWSELSAVIDSMGEAIRIYEEKQELLEKQELKKAEEQAALDRKNQEIQDRIDSFEAALQLLEGMKYQSAEADSLVTTAISKLGDLYGYAETDSYRARLDAAIRRIRSLPTQAQWDAQEAQKKADALSQGSRDQQTLYQTYLAEKRYWNTQSYGPGRN